MDILFSLNNSYLLKSDFHNTFVEVHREQRRFLKTSEKELLMFHQAGKGYKTKSLPSTKTQSDR